jgi:uncharacterized RDD family membrane protein YckC
MYTEAPRASLWRRLAAITYDALVLCALWMFAGFIAALFVQALVSLKIVSLQGYVDLADYMNSGWRNWLYLAYFALVTLWFYLYFWLKAGQTLGMRAWRMLLISADGKPLTLRQALIRLLTSLAGLGNFWLWIRWGKGLALQDQLAGTIVVVLTKEQSSALNLHRDAR